MQRSTLTEAGIDSRWNMDLFVALSEDVGGGRWSIRAQLRPLIDYVWLAAGLMALGGVLAATRSSLSVARGRPPEPPLAQRTGGGSDVSRFLIPAAIFLALAGVLYVGVVHSPNKSTMQSALLGKPAPAFNLPVLGNARHDTRAARSSPAGPGC